MFTKPRYEFKYIARIEVVEALRERLKDSMIPDPNAINGGYHVNSIYYDTPDLSCYYEKLDGEKCRFKLRVRWYGEIDHQTDLSSLKVYTEIKHRNNDMNYKNRAYVSGKHLPEFAENQDRLLRLGEIVTKDQNAEAATIERLTSQKSFFPICIVSYFRQPLLCRFNPRLRVTFDTNLRTLGPKSYNQTVSENGSRVLPLDLCVVEIKFNWAMPLWMIEICREVGLDLRRYSKYAASLENLYPQFAERQLRFQEALG
tara:strand:- start:593 stop:1363 length:771 start_codon:yes stop_codon:yes gene_type:complete